MPATLQCVAGLGQDPRTGAQAVNLQFVLPNPAGLVLGPDRYLARLVRELGVLAPAIARGDVLELRRNGDALETIGEHLANVAQLLRAVEETYAVSDDLQSVLVAIAHRIGLALALLEPAPLPDVTAVEQAVAASMQRQAPTARRPR